MPRPPFQNLPRERQEAILDIAATEFAEHGFAGASYNRVLERAGLAKGVAYYYFEGKEDLYLTIIRTAGERLIGHLGKPPDSRTPDEFWKNIRALYLSLLAFLVAHPREARLMRGFVQARSLPKLHEAYRELESGIGGAVAHFIDQGIEIGAVRTDVPKDLLLAIVLGAGQAGDLWVLDQWERHGERRARAGAEKVLSLIQEIAAPYDDKPRHTPRPAPPRR